MRRQTALLPQLFEVGPLACPTCCGLRRIIACITQASVIDQILARLPAAARGMQAAARHLRSAPRHNPLWLKRVGGADDVVGRCCGRRSGDPCLAVSGPMLLFKRSRGTAARHNHTTLRQILHPPKRRARAPGWCLARRERAT